MASLKSASTKVGKAVLVAIGVPYGIAIVVNSVHGWPQSDTSQGRFTKQLTPSRVLNLNYVLFQQMSMLKWLPLLLQANSVHKKADPTLQNIPFGENGLKMDIWLPKDVQNDSYVIFFIYGGAWGSGYKEIYAKLGQELANTLGAVVVIPDYRIYPKGNMSDMVLDITESIHEFRSQKDELKLSVNLNKTLLLGHSAGAHLSAMAAIHIATKNLEMPGEVELEHSRIPRTRESGSKSQGACKHSNPDGSNVKTDDFCEANDIDDEDQREPFLGDSTEDGNSRLTQRVDLAGSIRGLIAVGGVYHIMDHYHHEAKRGVEDISPMWRAAEGLENFEKYSPTCLVPKLTEDQKQRLPPQMLIHGMNDTTVPASASSRYAEILAEAGVHTSLKILPGAGHAELIMDMMEPSRKWYNVMMGAVMEGKGMFLGEE